MTLVGQCMRYMEVVYKGSLKWDKDISSCVSLTTQFETMSYIKLPPSTTYEAWTKSWNRFFSLIDGNNSSSKEIDTYYVQS